MGSNRQQRPEEAPPTEGRPSPSGYQDKETIVHYSVPKKVFSPSDKDTI